MLSIFSCAHKPLLCFPVGLFLFSTPLWLHLHFLNRPISLIPTNTLPPGTINTEAKDLSDLLPEPHTASLKSIYFSYLRKRSLTPKVQCQSTNRADCNSSVLKRFFSYVFFIIFTYFWLHWVFTAERAFCSCDKWGATLCCGIRASYYSSFLVAEHRF